MTITRATIATPITGRWTRATPSALARAVELARGSYQHGLATGHENLSGSSLRGKAARYGGVYAVSRKNFLGRLRAAGITVAEETGPRNARILILS